MYKIRRKLLSQNFLRNPELVKKLLRKSSIGKSDTVLEIGPGRGIITSELLRSAGKVIAIELDNNLYSHLVNGYRSNNKFEIVNANFLEFKLPTFSYKVFANIPFSITADIIRRLTSDHNFKEGYLIVQKEAARKFIGMPYDNKNQMMSALLKPWFDINVFYEFSRSDFYPRPNVDTVMIRISRVESPIIDVKEKSLYENFVLYTFNKFRVSCLEYKSFLNLFYNFLKRNNSKETA